MSLQFSSRRETIVALASALGAAKRGIVRVSGPDVWNVICRITRVPQEDIHPVRAQRYTTEVLLDEGQLPLPVDVYLWPTSKSFTGEPLAELHCIGSPPLLNELVELVCLAGVRPAERGEFTLRAFLAGRIDLIQAEAVLGVIDAADSNQLDTALQQLAGGISTKIGQVRDELLLHLADLEAGLDFVEEDIDFVNRHEFRQRLSSSGQFLEQLLQQSVQRMQSTGYRRVVLAGLPNAGKSTLFNALVNCESALVSEIAGTTRDYLSAILHDEHGCPMELIDTAGWEESRDGIEKQAGHLRAEQYRRADLILWCRAADLDAQAARQDAELLEQCQALGVPVLVCLTKAEFGEMPMHHVCTSAKQRRGIEQLKHRIAQELADSNADTELVGTTAARCRESLQSAVSALRRALGLIDQQAGDELIAIELRDVQDHLGRIVGEVYTDDILDRIFSRFCIGK